MDLVPAKREESNLYEAIPRRHTNRSFYDSQKPVPPEFIDVLSRLAAEDADVKILLYTAAEDRQRIAKVSSEANTELDFYPDVKHGSERWIRIQWSSIQKYRDGLTLDAMGLPPLTAAILKSMPVSMLRWAASRTPKSTYSNLMLSAPLIGLIAVRDRYDRQQCLQAGRVWQRAHLLATAHGLAGRPCNETVEMVDHEKWTGKSPSRAAMLEAITGDAGWQPTFVFYMGYPLRTALPSPRRSIQDVIIE